MSSEIAIRVRDITKHYLMFERPEHRLLQMIVPRLQRIAGRPPRHYYEEFTALGGISFDVHRGETIGIIGRNGSGKSTLLQVICGTLQPSAGSIEVNGRIAALLELGAGFNLDFTGRENVYMNATILGLSRLEIDERFDDIAAFADIGAFIDQPVKTYSSGMYVRLAFAVAINVDPDILVVDEALSVGDEAFQRKCFARIEEIQDNGGTILFVSHGAQTIVQLCSRAMLIDAGEVILEGQPKTVVGQYQRLVNLSGADAPPVRQEIKTMDGWAKQQQANRQGDGAQTPSGNTTDKANNGAEQQDDSWLDPDLTSHAQVEYEKRGAQIRDVRILTLKGRQVNNLQMGQRYYYEYFVDFEQTIENVGFGMMIRIVDGFGLGGAATDFSRTLRLKQAKAGSCYRVRFDLRWSLSPGTYFMNAGVTGSQGGEHVYTHRLIDALAFKIMPTTDNLNTGYLDLQPRITLDLVK